MEDTQHIWNKAFLEALDHDAWGQVEEACDGYQRLQVAAAVEHVENVLGLAPNRRDAIGKLASVLKLRIQELNSGTRGRIGLAGMQSLKPFLAGLILTEVSLPPAISAALTATSSTTSPDPATISSTARQQPHCNSGAGQDRIATTIYNPNDEADSIAEVTSKLAVLPKPGQQSKIAGAAVNGTASSGTLRPPVSAEQLQPGDTTLCLNFASWAVKDAARMVDPHVVITVRDSAGKLLEAIQESPQLICYPSDADKFSLGFSWHLQTPVNCLPEGAAVFAELRHYKPDKKKKSFKCYSYLEASELQATGTGVLEVYKKPADYKRKSRPTLLTSKPMYLQLTKQLRRH